MAATIVGTPGCDFGMAGNSAGLSVTTSVSVTTKRDKKELRGNDGNLIAVAYFNETADISVEGYGETSATIGSAVQLGVQFDLPSTVVIEEIGYTATNEDFVKSSIKATGYNF